jgi:hypothetical protein
MHCELVEDGVIPFHAELFAKQSMTPRGVYDHPRRHVNLLPCNPQANPAGVALVIKKHFVHLNALVDTGAQTFRVLQQQQIELLTIDVVGVLLRDSFLREFVERNIGFAFCHRWMPGSPILSWKAFPLQDGQKSDFVKDADGRHYHRFPYVGPRMVSAFEDRVLNSRLRQITAQGRPRRATANNQNVHRI